MSFYVNDVVLKLDSLAYKVGSTLRGFISKTWIMFIMSALGLISFNAWSQHKENNKSHATSYAELQSREIKSLSDKDIEQIQQGHGWGLALPAELNGLPGPKHVLELKGPLALSATQVDQITVFYQDMLDEAIVAGKRFIAAETAVNRSFQNQTPDHEQLRKLLKEAAMARADLRFIHLSRHLQTAKLLNPYQIEQYAILRGYTHDPCAQVPDGHNPDMWRQHNGCL